MRALCIMVTAGLLLSGCPIDQTRPDPDYAAVMPEPIPQMAVPDGSIYQEGHDVRLFEDIRAHRVGDILTVVLTESTDASKSATTNASKENNVTVTNPTLFGTPFNRGDKNLEIGAQSTQEFAGGGSSAQSNRLQGQIAVIVTEVYPNGNLRVRGEKIIALNQGDESVRLSGIVRARDISPSNIVLSTQIADARISYGGKGTVSNSNMLGWLSKFFMVLLPL
jgi:flagellar L-ring protein precursor FlgH